MKRFIHGIFAVILVASCGKQEQNTSFRSFESIRPKAKHLSKPKEKVPPRINYRLVKTELLNVAGICVDSIVSDIKPVFLSRFNPPFKEQVHLYCGANLTEFDFYEFNDSTALLNAMYNWFDRFEYQLSGLRLGQLEPIKKVDFMIKRGEKSLIFIHTNESLNLTNWNTYIRLLFPKSTWRMEVENTPRKIKWSRLEEIQIAHENR